LRFSQTLSIIGVQKSFTLLLLTLKDWGTEKLYLVVANIERPQLGTLFYCSRDTLYKVVAHIETLQLAAASQLL